MSDYSVDPGATIERLIAEREALQVRVNELREDFQELSEQSERRGRQASEFEERMGDLQSENVKLQDRITLLSDSGEHVESHLEKQVDILRIRCDALQQRLTAADERADVQYVPVMQWSDDGSSWMDGQPNEIASARSYGWQTRTLYSKAPDIPPAPAEKCTSCDGSGSVCIDWDSGSWSDCPECAKP